MKKNNKETSNFVHVKEQTDEEKLKMYMKSTKKELAEMLLHANKLLDNGFPSNFTWISKTETPFKQLCPKCGGQGIVSKPPHIAGDVLEWVSSEGVYTCNVCNGNKIINEPVIVEL